MRHLVFISELVQTATRCRLQHLHSIEINKIVIKENTDCSPDVVNPVGGVTICLLLLCPNKTVATPLES